MLNSQKSLVSDHAINQANETWQAIPGFPLYEASSLGRIRSLDNLVKAHQGFRLRKGKVLTPVKHHTGYIIYTLHNGKQHAAFGHRLVALAFLGERPDGCVICHKDGDRANNALVNLRYDTQSANERDKLQHGTYQQDEKNPRAKLTRPEIVAMRLERAAGEPLKSLALRYGFRAGHISKICTGMIWKNTSGPLTRENKRNA